ncbi:RHS repeat domain-containing protein [Apibacter mensalis]|uniref:RHS repeat domain-containing protein n=1 Tax=Apibacter mensalis TaxID=1586267 RepID=UPI0026F069DB|nr:RHS repeat-associated core domain-containing protein [Apibacter mensalis]
MGGQMQHEYTYDGLYRLVQAQGSYTGADNKTAAYSLQMGYDNLHNIVSKNQQVSQQGIMIEGGLKAGYDLSYTYDSTKKNQIRTVQDINYREEESQEEEKRQEHKNYHYDLNGNLTYVNVELEKKDLRKTSQTQERKLRWDEENRLMSIDDNGYVSNYVYDATGERVIKTSGESEQVYINSLFSGGNTETQGFTAYINPFLVVSSNGKYTKHYYAGSQRIVSKLGDIESFGADPRRIEYAGSSVPGVTINWKAKYQRSIQDIKGNYAYFEVPYNGKDNDDYVNGEGFCCSQNTALRAGIGIGNVNYEKMQYYYHPDHLGSSSYITNLDGEIVQHVEYVPFGEVFIEERNNSWNTPYLFNGKELDEETGLYYYGARYYNPRESIFLSVDPLYDKTMLIYQYTYQNPIKYTDPTGMKTEGVDPENETVLPEIVVVGKRRPSNNKVTKQQQEKERRSREAYQRYLDAYGGKPLMHTDDVKNWTLGALCVIFGPVAAFEGIAAGFFSLSELSFSAFVARTGTDAAVQTAANMTTNGGDLTKAIGDVNLTQSGLAGLGMNYVGNALLSSSTPITINDGMQSVFNGTLEGKRFVNQATLGVMGGAAATGISGSQLFKGTVIGTYMQTSVRFGQTAGSKAATVLMNAPDYGVNVIQNKLD